jgi:hypothetical protein
MASKQLEILIRARDQASKTFQEVGDSASGLGNRLKALDSIMETGHGIHSMLRQGRNVVTLFEVAPFGIHAFTAALATMSGTAQQAAEGQRALYESLKEIPIIGKQAAKWSEYFGTKLAHAFGKQSTAELEADLKAKKEALKTYAEVVKKLPDELTHSNREAALVGLAPDDAEIAKAQDKYQEAIEKLKPLKQAVLAKAGAISGDSREDDQQYELQQLQSTAREITQMQANAEKIRDDALGKLRQQREERTLERNLKDIDEQVKQGQTLVSLQNDLNAKLLESDNRLYESQQSALKAAVSNRLTIIGDTARAEVQAIEAESRALQAQADKGNHDAINRIAENKARIARINTNAADQTSLVVQGENAELSANRDKAIRDARLSSLRAEAEAGNAVASVELARLNTSREQEDTERSLQAVIKDEQATDAQRLAARQQLAELGRAQFQTRNAELQSSELSILEKQAALGDESAKLKIQQLQTTREQQQAEAQLNAILADRNSTDQQRVEAQRQLAQLKQLGQAQSAGGVRDAALFALQQEASLGDKIAERQLRKVELEKQYADQKQRLLGILQSETANEQVKADARKTMAALDSSEARALKQLGRAEKQQPELANLQESGYLTGVSARASQETDPVIDSNRENTKSIVDAINDLAAYFKGLGNPTKVLR